MKYSLDGGRTYQDVGNDGIRVIIDDLTVDCEVDGKTPNDGTGELHINITEEGIVQDVWVPRDIDENWTPDDPEEANVGTSSQTIDEVVEQLVRDSSDD
jgi:hypothetical protein